MNMLNRGAINQEYWFSLVIEFSKIVVGIDGSEESMKAVEFAITMANIYRCSDS